MKGNTDKCHLIMSTNNTPKLKVGDSFFKTSACEKLLGAKIDYKLTFDNYVANLCKKANNKLRALARATPYVTIEKRKLLMNSFSMHSLITAPLYGSYIVVAIKMYKVKNELAPMITANVFTTIPGNHYNLRNYNDFRLPFARTVYHGTESISYLGPKI